MEVTKVEDVIKNLCLSLKGEAKAVISYVEKISSTPVTEETADVIRTFAKNMLDNVDHIQSLTIKLSENIGEVIPATLKGSKQDG